MSLTGRPLIALTLLLTVAVATATVRWWRLPGRRRLPVRVAGLLTFEILVLTSAGLIVNRTEGFYPSWPALTGTEPTTATTAPVLAGRLDGKLTTGPVFRWTPAEAAAWHLAGPPTVVVPPAYHRYADRTFPVIVALTTAGRAAATRTKAQSAAGVLTVVVVPTPATTAAALATLPGVLLADLRAARTGWAIVTDTAHAALARQWQTLAPAQFRTVTGSLDTALDAMPAPLRAPVRLSS